MDADRIQLDALELLLQQEIDRRDLNHDQYAVLYQDYPESHVFFGSDFDSEDAHEAIWAVMTNDIAAKIRWATSKIELLRDEKRFTEELAPESVVGFADMIAMEAAERAAGC